MKWRADLEKADIHGCLVSAVVFTSGKPIVGEAHWIAEKDVVPNDEGTAIGGGQTKAAGTTTPSQSKVGSHIGNRCPPPASVS